MFFHIYGTVYARVLSSKKTPLCFVHGAINPHSILAPLPRALRRRRHPAPWVLGQHCRCLSGWVGRMQLSISTLLFYRISLFFCVQLSINHYLYHDLSIIIYLSLSIYLSIYLTNLPIDPCIHVSMYPCIHPSIRPSIHPSTYIVLRVHISTWYMDRYSSYPSTGWTNIGHSNRVERWLGLVKSVHGIVTLW